MQTHAYNRSWPVNSYDMIVVNERGFNRTSNIDGAEAVRVSHNATLVTRMPLATIALLCKQTCDNFRICPPPNAPWRHLTGNRKLFVPQCIQTTGGLMDPAQLPPPPPELLQQPLQEYQNQPPYQNQGKAY